MVVVLFPPSGDGAQGVFSSSTTQISVALGPDADLGLTIRGGAEYAVRPSTVVRGGGFFDPSPARDQHLAPSSPDSTRVGLTAGASHEIARDVTVDGFYEYMHLFGRENGGMDNLAARYGGRAHILGLGVRVSR